MKEYQFKISKDLDKRVDGIVYGYINQWDDDFLITDMDISVFLMYIEHKLKNLQEGREINKITGRTLKGK